MMAGRKSGLFVIPCSIGTATLAPMQVHVARVIALLSAFVIFEFGGTDATARSRAVHTFRDCDNCPLMTIVPAGHFLMGSAPTEAGRTAQEGPQHAVVIRYTFAVSTFDISHAEFAVFAKQTNFSVPEARCDWRAPRAGGVHFGQGPTDPVVCVSWQDAQAYVAWLRGKTGKAYRLLSEAEWEYAARAGTSTARPWGQSASHDRANTGAAQCCAPFASGRDRWLHTSPAGSFPSNAFGLGDMLGNVWQWVEDCASDDYADAPTDGAARNVGSCDLRVVRGGSWFHPPDMARSASRAADREDFRVGDIGFRVAQTLSGSP
jgi:formylglycine-generating enzyme required for sulfatase activity